MVRSQTLTVNKLTPLVGEKKAGVKERPIVVYYQVEEFDATGQHQRLT